MPIQAFTSLRSAAMLAASVRQLGPRLYWIAVMTDVVSSMTAACDQKAKQLQPSAPQKPE
jgi:hypothetical protein